MRSRAETLAENPLVRERTYYREDCRSNPGERKKEYGGVWSEGAAKGGREQERERREEEVVAEEKEEKEEKDRERGKE